MKSALVESIIPRTGLASSPARVCNLIGRLAAALHGDAHTHEDGRGGRVQSTTSASPQRALYCFDTFVCTRKFRDTLMRAFSAH